MKSKLSLEIGQIFTRLKVIEFLGRGFSGKKIFLCECLCGKTKKVDIYSLISSNTQSCGCLGIENRKIGTVKSCTTHGESRSVGKTGEYLSWLRMRERCKCKKGNRWHKYGGRGIKVCDRWLNSYENFLHDMGRKPTEKHSLDRINNDGNYEPSNCRWATNKDQSRNKTTTIYLTLGQTKKSLTDWCDLFKSNPTTIRCRLRRSWDINENLFCPPIEKYRNKLYDKRG